MEMAEAIDLIRSMIAAAHEDEYEYRGCAGEALSDELCAMLSERAERAAIYRRELEDLFVLIATESRQREPHAGTMRAMETLHRTGMRCGSRAAPSPVVSDEALLLECERKEDELLMRYRDVLEEELPPEVRSVLELQFAALLEERAYSPVSRVPAPPLGIASVPPPSAHARHTSVVD